MSVNMSWWKPEPEKKPVWGPDQIKEFKKYRRQYIQHMEDGTISNAFVNKGKKLAAGITTTQARNLLSYTNNNHTLTRQDLDVLRSLKMIWGPTQVKEFKEFVKKYKTYEKSGTLHNHKNFMMKGKRLASHLSTRQATNLVMKGHLTNEDRALLHFLIF